MRESHSVSTFDGLWLARVERRVVASAWYGLPEGFEGPLDTRLPVFSCALWPGEALIEARCTGVDLPDVQIRIRHASLRLLESSLRSKCPGARAMSLFSDILPFPVISRHKQLV